VNESVLSYYVPKDWRLLAALDESEPYEVDVTEIYQRPDGKLILATASGCSCWDGDYDTDEFDTLDALWLSAKFADNRRWNPSWRGSEELVREARVALEETAQ